MSNVIGVFGGTFDPIHLGHLIAAESAREALGLREVRLIPAGRPPHRDSGAVASDTDRLAMTRLAVENRPGLIVDDREFQPGVSPFTFDTLESVAAENPDSKVMLITGQDWVNRLDTWHRSHELLATFGIIVLLRPDRNGNVVTIDDSMYKCVDNPVIGISSTDIRQRVCEGRSIRFLVPQAVESYILERKLYR